MFGVNSYGQKTTICSIDSIKKGVVKNQASWLLTDINLEKGRCFLDHQIYDTAIYYFNKVNRNAIQTNNTVGQARSLYYLGISFYELENGLEANDYLNKALIIPDGLSLQEKTQAYNKIGIINLNFEEHKKAITFFNRAILAYKKADFEESSYDFLYNNKGIAFERDKNFDSSFFNQKYCLSIRLAKQFRNRPIL